ncbi:MAG: protein translocase subunit SecDF [Crocinitomix sp.]|nr:protein translocase subunit SecDF [Crocinitomix sp.]
MRNKGFFWSITIALALACLYQLSFTYATNAVEKDAEKYAVDKLDSLRTADVEFISIGADSLYLSDSSDVDILQIQYTGDYIKSKMHEEVHFAGYTYAECKESEINLGLDLKGGMSATLEISVPALVADLAGGTRSQEFKTPFDKANQRTNLGEGAFIDLFVEEFEKQNEGVLLAKYFHGRNQEEVEKNASNAEVAEWLKDKAVKALDGVEIIIEKRVNQFGVAQPTIIKQPGTNRIFVELPGISDKETVRRRLQTTANLEFYEVYENKFNGIAGLILQSEPSLSRALYGEELIEVESDDLANDSLSNVPSDTLNIDTPDDSSEIDPLLAADDDLLNNDDLLDEDGEQEVADSLLTDAQIQKKYPISSLMSLAFRYNETGEIVDYQEGSVVGYANVKDTAELNFRLNHEVMRISLPQDLVFMWDSKELESEGQPNGLVGLHAIKVPLNGPRVDGRDIQSAAVDNRVVGEFGVSMKMNQIGATKWEEMTTDNLNKQVAITMDGSVFSAPVVNGVMNVNSSITGNFTSAEANDLSGLLNAGALPAPVKIVDESIVGPTLGAANISAGMWSFVFALLLVLVYMVFYYNKAGLVADAALVINIFLLIGALASLKAILTLPGIAGIVLTIGMSVDANVLIFERIREELRHKKGLKTSIKEGYAKALSAILDANITTLLTGVVLAIFGTGPIKGFATTLIIGIFTSFFAAVIITRLIIMAFVDKDKKISFSTKITENWFTKSNIQFVKKRKLFYIVSGVIIAIGMTSFLSRGLDYGVDFTGGRQYKIVFNDDKADIEGIKASLTDQFEGNAPGVKMVDNNYTALVTTKYRMDENANIDKIVLISDEIEALVKGSVAKYGDSEIVESKMIAPTISKDLKSNSFYAIGFSLLIIFLYILFRFRKWQYGLGALIAMAHDVLVVLSLFSLFWGILPFTMEIDQAFIAAILTVVGYSINDTVVVFDRIREYLGLYPKKERKEVINMALNSTLGRTVNTSVSTFIVLLVIFLFGGAAIKGFVFALMIGVVVGTYSSLFIATPAVIDFTKKEEEKK